MRRAYRRILTLAAATLSAGSAAANDSSRVAEVVVAGDDAEVALVRAGVDEQLERIGVRADTVRRSSVAAEEVVRPSRADGPVVARVWIDSRSESETILYVTDESASRVLVRRFPREGRVEIAREAVMAVLQTSIDALMHGAAIGVSREEARAELGLAEPPPPAPKCPPPPAPPAPLATAPRTTLALGIGYEVGGYAANAVEHGPVATIELVRPFGERVFGFTLSGQYRFPMTAEHDPFALRLETGAFRLAAFGTVVRMHAVDLRAFAGGGVDVVRAEPGLLHVVDATLRPTTRLDVVFRAGASLRARLAWLPHGAAELGVACELAPFVSAYTVSRSGIQSEVLVPWTVRPLVFVGFALP